MLLAQLPISVLLQRQTLRDRWCSVQWRAVAVLPDDPAHQRPLSARPDAGLELHLQRGLCLDVHRDDTDGCFENWVAPEPKVFVLWQLQQGRAVVQQVSVSYAEGARMLDAGGNADGVAMPGPVHDWLGACLRAHHRPPPQRRGHGRGGLRPD